ncbi:polysaccharide pyruvyl transferase family protein [Streptomyces sp. NPDC048845]|uniref:polysaccharide pyruvyl transferase family protein n=1 Tax=Streptomyces sp. NPDC048845 TaxID=3155390 RepID=UPI00344767B6
MKRILLRSGKSPFEVVSREQAIQRNVIATNSGNLLFSDAAHKILLTDGTEVESNRMRVNPSEAARINEEYDAFVVPLANAFRPSFETQLNKLSAFIEKLDIPVVVLGVGAQTGLGYSAERLRPLEASVKRFVRAVLDRSASIGVRGEFTEKYVRDLGFRDVEVIGCPSMFMNGDTFEITKRTETLTAESRISVNVSAAAAKISDVGGLMRHAYDLHPDLIYVAQNLTDAELLLWGDLSEAEGRSGSMPLQSSHPFFRDDKVRLFIDPATWLDELRGRDFSFGTRIHGNIAALLAGTPAVVLAHDSRTLELCRYFDIPHRSVKDVHAGTDPAELYEAADFGKLREGHRERFDRFMSFLDRNGLENTFAHGDGGAAYDARVASLDLPPALRAWDGSPDGLLGYRISRLRQEVKRARSEQSALNERLEKVSKENAALARRLAALEGAGGGTSPYRRARRAVGRRVRQVRKRLG